MWTERLACGASLIVIVLSIQNGCFAGYCTNYYECSNSCYRQQSYTTSCGFLWLSRCKRYRAVLSTCTQVCSRQTCCAGFQGQDCNTSVCYGSTTCPNGGKCLGPDTCQCPTGYQKPRCADINECVVGTSGCAHNCTNTVGSYECSCTEGYTLALDKHQCEDNDECVAGTSGCAHNCTNTVGSYECSCTEGYTLALDKHQCEG